MLLSLLLFHSKCVFSDLCDPAFHFSFTFLTFFLSTISTLFPALNSLYPNLGSDSISLFLCHVLFLAPIVYLRFIYQFLLLSFSFFSRYDSQCLPDSLFFPLILFFSLSFSLSPSLSVSPAPSRFHGNHLPFVLFPLNSDILSQNENVDFVSWPPCFFSRHLFVSLILTLFFLNPSLTLSLCQPFSLFVSLSLLFLDFSIEISITISAIVVRRNYYFVLHVSDSSTVSSSFFLPSLPLSFFSLYSPSPSGL